MKKLGAIDGLEAPIFASPHFNEFTLRCTQPKLAIKKLNAKLLKQGIQGGKPIKGEFPEFGETALLCTTELHRKEDIDRLADVAAEAVGARK
jgi:glycine dehydrogenase subunit 1